MTRPGWSPAGVSGSPPTSTGWRPPGGGFSDVRRGVAASVALNEVVVHGWDLARGLGRDFTARDEDVAACMAFAEPFSAPGTEAMRGTAFGPVVPVPPEAPALTRLLGLMGRRAG